MPQHRYEGGFHQLPHLPLRSPRLHGALLAVYSDLSLSLLPPCGPSRLSGCLLTTPKSSRKAVYLCPDTPNDLPLSVIYTQGVRVPSGVEMDMTSQVSILLQPPDMELSHISPLQDSPRAILGISWASYSLVSSLTASLETWGRKIDLYVVIYSSQTYSFTSTLSFETKKPCLW